MKDDLVQTIGSKARPMLPTRNPGPWLLEQNVACISIPSTPDTPAALAVASMLCSRTDPCELWATNNEQGL